MTDSNLFLPIVGLICGLWVAAAVYAIWRGMAMRARADRAIQAKGRLRAMIDSAPALPLLVRGDGRIELGDGLRQMMGLERSPTHLADLSGGSRGGIDDAELKMLQEDVRLAQRTGKPFRRTIRLVGTKKLLICEGQLADAKIYPNGAALIWIFDGTESEGRLRSVEAELDEARNAFAAISGIIEAAPFPMWFRAPDLRLSLVNRAYVAAVGGDSADQVVEQGIELIETVDGLSPIAAASRAKDTDNPVEREIATTISGERRRVRSVDVSLGAVGVAGYAIDMQESADIAREFRHFASAQRSMLDNMSAGVAQFDADQNLVFTNLPFRRLFSMRDEWLSEGPDFARLLDRMREAARVPEVRDFGEWRQEREQWFRSPEPVEESWLLSDGTHIRVLAQPMPDGGLLLIFEDRTEQVRLASARDTLLRVRTATFDNLFEAIAVFGPDGRLNTWNRRFADIWELDEAELSEHPRMDNLLSELTPQMSDPEAMDNLSGALRSVLSSRKDGQGRLARKNGDVFDYSAIPLPDGNVLLTLVDITASQRVEQALRERGKALAEADRIKGQFLENMGYEFRTPLTSIGGFAELLQAGVAGDLSEQAQEYVDAILQSSARLTEQIETVMDYSQSQAGVLPIARNDIVLEPLLKEVAEQFHSNAGVKDQQLRTRFLPSLGKVKGDEKRLSQAVEQIIANAVAYTPAGGEILVYGDGTKAGARIVVSDNGAGMSPAEQARAFDGFARSHAETDVLSGGLGLPLARQLIEAHGGTLTLISEPGEGTAVTIELPRT